MVPKIGSDRVNTEFRLYRDSERRDENPPKFAREDIPALPGLYAWYLDFSNPQGKVDVNQFLAAYQRFLTLVSGDQQKDDRGRYLVQLSSPTNGFEVYRAELYRSTSSSTPNQKYDEVRNHKSGQEILHFLLGENFLSYLSPLYVGKADDLSVRYSQHKRAFDDASKGMRLDMSIKENEFGSRLAAANIKFDDVLFGCIGIDYKSLEITIEEALIWIGVAEHYFNYIVHPIFGRR
jgi:hypothetical protein